MKARAAPLPCWTCPSPCVRQRRATNTRTDKVEQCFSDCEYLSGSGPSKQGSVHDRHYLPVPVRRQPPHSGRELAPGPVAAKQGRRQWRTRFLEPLLGWRVDASRRIRSGVMPYITSSIVIQLLTTVIPKLTEWRDQGAVGQKRITQTTRYLTIGLALLQSTGLIYAFHGHEPGVARF